jgi:hypothetical protein
MLHLLFCASAATTTPVHFGEWNVYWKALDDAAGRAAIVSAIDAYPFPFDFFTLVEAQGDTPGGAFPDWTRGSSGLRQLTPITTVSQHETLALFYDAAKWTLTFNSSGYFDLGRPWLLANFADANSGASLWAVAVHLPHFLDTTTSPGTILADALRAASAATGLPTTNVILAGDWNEFQWEDNPCIKPFYPPDCRAQAKARMADLWDGLFHGDARDLALNHTITCCTKWAAADRHTTSYEEWRFEYDHVFATSTLNLPPPGVVANPVALIPYVYPGTAAPCDTPACTGEDPPGNVTATSQGSWHRGWSLALELSCDTSIDGS